MNTALILSSVLTVTLLVILLWCVIIYAVNLTKENGILEEEIIKLKEEKFYNE